NDSCACALCYGDGVVGRAVIHHDNFVERMCLPGKIRQECLKKIPPVPMRNHGGHRHENRFLKRNQRLYKPSRHGLSLISPSRELYRIESSAKRWRFSFSASI